MRAHARFTCFAGCNEHYELDEIVYRCKQCGALLDVEHNIEALKERSGAAWMQTFDRRWMRTEWPYGSGVWGKLEWVYPGIDPSSIVSFAEGGSNLLWAERYARSLGLTDVWIKQCGNSHTGSFKDLGMTVLVSAVREMNRRGQLHGFPPGKTPVRAIACASTGDTSAALAAYCAAAGLPALVLLPKDKVSIAQLLQPLANGAIVISLETDFDGCMKVVQQLTEDGSIYLANSMNSLRIEGQKTMAVELVQQFDWAVPDWVIIPGGNLGNVYAMGKGFLMMKELGLISRLPRICVAQAERANPLYLAFKNGFENYAPVKAQKTAASAIQIGDPVSIDRAIRVLKQFEGVVEQASEQELSDAVARADRTGMYNCPHTGVALAALEKLAAKKMIAPDERVVVISTAHGLKFTEFKRAYHAGEIEGTDARLANTPIELPPDVDRVRAAIDARLGA